MVPVAEVVAEVLNDGTCGPGHRNPETPFQNETLQEILDFERCRAESGIYLGNCGNYFGTAALQATAFQRQQSLATEQ